VPVLRRSLFLLLDAGCKPVVAAVPEDLVADASELAADLSEVKLVTGGSSRQESVAKGLAWIDSEIVVVHDAARPLAPAGLVSKALDALGDRDGAVVALPMDETLKEVEAGAVVATVDRSRLWTVQTPQVFRASTLRLAYERARVDGFAGTDDAQLVERSGGKIAVVEGERSNLKLTYEEDFELAERWLRSR
jgi:2-C-methyl-D-erythritol 4-phosphate cytidylyltransferase